MLTIFAATATSLALSASPVAANPVCEILEGTGERSDCPVENPPDPPVQQSTDPNGASGCTLVVENPHVSSGTPTDVVAKTRVTCSRSVVDIDLTLILFRCPNQPSGPENTWNTQGCVQAGWNQDNVPLPKPGDTYTRQVSAPYIANSWWVGCTVWKVKETATSTGYYGQSQSNAVRL